MNQGSDLGRLLRAALYGALLSLGLTLGGVARAEIVLGGLDLVDFDPRLYVFFAGALFTFGALFRLSRRRTQPYCAARFSEPPQGKVDGRLVAGAALFGLGWGLTGVCPGPAVVGLGARLANGCTSGHGICGVGRLSVRSIASCALFLVCGMLAGAALRLGGAS